MKTFQRSIIRQFGKEAVFYDFIHKDNKDIKLTFCVLPNDNVIKDLRLSLCKSKVISTVFIANSWVNSNANFLAYDKDNIKCEIVFPLTFPIVFGSINNLKEEMLYVGNIVNDLEKFLNNELDIDFIMKQSKLFLKK